MKLDYLFPLKSFYSFLCLLLIISFVCPSAQASIPSSLATVQEEYISNFSHNKKEVIIIQDLHTSTQVQENISDVIRYYVNEQNVQAVAYEGNEGIVEVEKLFWFSDIQLKKEVAGSLLKKLRLSGPEYARVVNKKPFELLGIENHQLYQKNIQQFRKALYLRQDAKNRILSLRKQLLRSLAEVATPDGKKLHRMMENFHNQRLKLTDYLLSLMGWFEGGDASLSDLPHVKLLLDWIEENRVIDADLLIQEYEELLKDLKIDKRAFQLESNEGMQSKAFWSYFEALQNEVKQNYPYLNHWVSYQIKIQKMRSWDLFEELELLENRVTKKVMKRKELKVVHALKYLDQIKRIVSLKATRADWDSYLKNKNVFQESYFNKIINKVLGSKQKSSHYDVALEDLLKAAAEFYLVAQERDEVITHNLFSVLKRHNRVVLVVGGFHTEGLVRQLKKQKISYSVLSPHYKGQDLKAEKRYFDSMMNLDWDHQKDTISLFSAAFN